VIPWNAVRNFVQAILGIHLLDRADLEALSEATASSHARVGWSAEILDDRVSCPDQLDSKVRIRAAVMFARSAPL
jgi:hypothetical protein